MRLHVLLHRSDDESATTTADLDLELALDAHDGNLHCPDAVERYRETRKSNIIAVVLRTYCINKTPT